MRVGFSKSFEPNFQQCMYVMYVCYVCMYVCMHVCMYVYMYICMYVCVCMCVYVCMFVGICMHACMYACMPACVYASIYVMKVTLLYFNTMIVASAWPQDGESLYDHINDSIKYDRHGSH